VCVEGGIEVNNNIEIEWKRIQSSKLELRKIRDYMIPKFTSSNDRITFIFYIRKRLENIKKTEKHLLELKGELK
jgi:hypothetical protein